MALTAVTEGPDPCCGPIAVVGVSGDELCRVSSQQAANVGQLKKIIQELEGTPVTQQWLLVGSRVLLDDDDLPAGSGGEVVIVTLLRAPPPKGVVIKKVTHHSPV
ncbi:unnamed protein product [Polarella glacialis]|uniref:Ubiquitin-like domain-containing protein n=1 Tax=Polarella glacialis TaxID=89957 RepID=A0A813G1B8_POLGL|nr:unnamed protein product [Polarella glacialis]